MTGTPTPPSGGVFVFSRADVAPLLAIVLLPIALALPQLFGYFHADPMVYRAKVTSEVASGVLPGVPYIDPNDGFQTQAVGVRAAKDWLKGTVPWWNTYTG